MTRIVLMHLSIGIKIVGHFFLEGLVTVSCDHVVDHHYS